MSSLVESWVSEITVLVVGDVMLDRYTQGVVHRVSPEAPVPVVVRNSESVTPGGAGNAATNVAALGDRAAVVAAVGDDADGAELRAALVRAGVDASGLVATGAPTCVKHRVVAAGQQIVRIDTESDAPLSADDVTRLLSEFHARLDSADAVLLSDYAKGVCCADLCRQVIDAANAAGKPIVVDPKGSDFAVYRGATVVTPNVTEAHRATEDDAGIDDMGRLLVKATGGWILITRGSEGMTLYGPDQEPVDLPARAQHVYDVTGAGDTVAAVIAVGVGHGLPLAKACWLANEAAAIAVSRRGTTAVSRAELQAATTG